MASTKVDVYDEINNLRKKLLDMSLRNNLLNFKILERTIPIVDENILELFKILILDKNSMEFLPHNLDENETTLNDYSNTNLFENNIWKIPRSFNEIPDKHKDLFLQTNLNETKLQKKLFSLHQIFKTNIEEQGYNNLFLALGFLEWKEQSYEEQTHISPLILLPVSLYRDSIDKPFKIKWTHDDLKTNMSLQLKLLEQQIDFPLFENLESKQELMNYFKQIENKISSKKDWKIRSDIYLSTFNFKKIVMYKDLDLTKWSSSIENNEINSIFNPNAKTYNSINDFEIDNITNSQEVFHVLDADSSQISVIEEIKRGNNLVVEGPPGTGKSQTIVNLIAELMANNKTILFVSEKMAALEVVKNRLDSIGLAEGCLELHSHKTNKKDVLKELEKTLFLDKPKNVNTSNFSNLDSLKIDLNDYILSINKNYGMTELSAYTLMGIKENQQQNLEKNKQKIYNVKMNNLDKCTPERQGELLQNIEEIANAYKLVKPIIQHPWKDILPKELSPEDKDLILSYLEDSIINLTSMTKLSEKLVNITKCAKLNNIHDSKKFICNLKLLNNHLRIFEDNEVNTLIKEVENYQITLNSFNFNNQLPYEFDNAFLNLNQIIKDIDLFNNISDIVSNETKTTKIKNLNELDAYISNLNILKPNLKIIENDDCDNLIAEIVNYQQMLNEFCLLKEDFNLKIIKTKLNLLKENFDLLIININELSEKTGTTKIKNLREIDEILDNIEILKYSNLKKIEDDIEFLIKKIINYQNQEKINNKEIFTLNLDKIQLTLKNILKKSNKLKLNYKIIFEENFFNLMHSFIECIETIENLPISKNTEIKNITYRLSLFKNKKDQISRYINKDFKEAKNYLYSHHLKHENDLQIINDFEQYIDNTEKLNDLRMKILIYSTNTLENKQIIKELKILSDMKHKLNEIEEELSIYINLNYTNIKKLYKEVTNLIEIKKIYDIIKSNNQKGEYYFGKLWEGVNSNTDNLMIHWQRLLEFNEKLNNGFFSNNTLNYNEHLNKNLINNYSEKIRLLKIKIINIYDDLDNLIQFKNKLSNINKYSNDINEFNSLICDFLNNILNLIKWDDFKNKNNEVKDLIIYDFESLLINLNNIIKFSENNYLINIQKECEELKKLKDLNNHINLKNELGKKYFGDMWEGSFSNITNLNKHYKLMNKFTILVNNNFFKEKTINTDLILINNQLDELKELKNKIIINYTSLNNFLIFKNDLSMKNWKNYDLIHLNEDLNKIKMCLTDFKKWDEYKKSNQNIYTLFDYDLEKLNVTITKYLAYVGIDFNLKDEITTLTNLKETSSHIHYLDNKGKYYFNDKWGGVESNIKDLKNQYQILMEFNNLIKIKFYTPEILNIKNNINLKKFNECISTFEKSYNSILILFSKLEELLTFNGDLNSKNKFNIPFSTILDKFKLLQENFELIENWRLFNNYCQKYNNEYLEEYITLIFKDKIEYNSIVPLFKYNLSNNMLKKIMAIDLNLRDFNKEIYEQKIKNFKELDKKIIEYNRNRVKNILYAQRPNINGIISPNSELGGLLNQMNKKRKIKSIRNILADYNNVIKKIKPCFMMSPLSVAQYLKPNIYESYFDYIIFDEASQVKTEDAIGALLRGKNYVIMGDSKQLPPTTFFDNDLITKEDENSEYTEIESILKLCKTILPDKMLKWHYRSRHESLISTSNYEFYNNELIVYPSPFAESEELGLKFEYNPDTYYDKGRSAKNIGEAKKIIEYAIKHFEKYGNKKSLGIGTFSTKQKQAILEELELQLKTNPHLSIYFNTEGENGFFIKNLENIQGDERDVILISIGYGFDINHKLSLNFGPLNKNGGERRLNVLITRAREKCVIFANFHSGDMNVTEKSSLGIKALKDFLYFAEEKEFPKNTTTGEDFDSPFEESVYNFLIDQGYSVEKQVGCAGYKIDLAIRDKSNYDNYIIGIECDGASYHSSTNARDRDRLRQQILEGLGWEFHRIWSTDWYNNRNIAKQSLLKRIQKAENKNEKIKKSEEFKK